jgi:phosphate transport system protein
VSTHYEASLERQIEQLRQLVLEMAARAESSLNDCITALEKSDRQLAYAVILRDRYIDELDRRIDRQCLEFLIRQQPVGKHLRFAAAVIKVNLELERVGDYAKSIAKQVIKLGSLEGTLPIDTLLDLGRRAVPMLARAVQAFVNEDVPAAQWVIAEETKTEALRGVIGEMLFDERQAGRIPLEAFSAMNNVARRFERVADQAKNVSQETLYMVTGDYVKHRDLMSLGVVFLDATNSRASQMAEAIGRALRNPNFQFMSAGVEPQPLDPGLIEIMRQKGYDLSDAQPKRTNEVPDIDSAQVFVVLSPRARSIVPANPRAVTLEWIINDPADHARTFEFLKKQIDDLVAALIGRSSEPIKITPTSTSTTP